ncbi:MAG: helix-turn-helix domain-containing protein [Bacteroidaceae bacterium]|nr:helix-turn-helix domain-containing protein [Bacteroidaceae bacterium]
MFEHFISSVIYAPIYICITYAMILFYNWKSLQIPQKIFAVSLIPSACQHALITGILTNDFASFPALLLIDSFMSPFLAIQVFIFVYSLLQKRRSSEKFVFLLIPVISFILCLLSYNEYGNEMVKMNHMIWTFNFKSGLKIYYYAYAAMYYIFVLAVSIFDIIYAVTKVVWYDKLVKKYIADSDLQVVPVRQQLTLYLVLLTCTTLELMILTQLPNSAKDTFGIVMAIIIFVLQIKSYRAILYKYTHLDMIGDDFEKEEAAILTPQLSCPNVAATEDAAICTEQTKPAENDAEDATLKQADKQLLDYVSEAEIGKRLEEVMDEEKLYLHQGITLKDLAAAINTNHTYLSVYLNRILNLNFSEYINKLRIEREILPLLKADPNISTKELILRSNCATRATFYRAFRKVTGLTVAEYKDKLNGNK